MSPKTNGGPGVTSSRPTTNTATATARPQVPSQRTATVQEVTVLGTLLLAAGDATHDWIMVRRCSLCGFAHRHLVFEANASVITRSPSCARHRTYRVIISDVVPSVSDRRSRGEAA